MYEIIGRGALNAAAAALGPTVTERFEIAAEHTVTPGEPIPEHHVQRVECPAYLEGCLLNSPPLNPVWRGEAVQPLPAAAHSLIALLRRCLGVGIMEYKHAKIQVLDIPGLIKGASTGSGMGKGILSVIRSANLIVFITEPYSLQQIDVLKSELYKAGIRIDESTPNVRIKKKEKGGIDLAATVKLTKIDKKTIEGILREFSLDNASIVIREDITADQLIDVIQGNRAYMSSLVIVNKADTASEQQLSIVRKSYPDALIMSANHDNLEKLKKAIFERLKLIRIFLKQAGKKADLQVPLVVKQNCTIEDVCKRLHKDFVKRFKNAKVWGTSAKFPGQIFHQSHVLMDKDVVQINLK